MRRANLATLALGLGWLGLLLVAVLLSSCERAPAASPSANPLCDPQRLAELEGLYLAEVIVLCKGYELETCPAVPELERRHAARIEEWIRCR